MTASQAKPPSGTATATIVKLSSVATELACWSSGRVSEDPQGAYAFAEGVLAESSGVSPRIEAEALRIRGMAAFRLDRMPQAYADATRAAELASVGCDIPGRLKARNLMATSSLMMGETDRAKAILNEDLPAARTFGDEQIVSQFLGNLAGIALSQAKVFEAIELLHELQGIADRNGLVDEWIGAANNLASCYLGLRDAESAAHICRHALQKFDQHADMRNNRAYLLHSLGCAMEQMGELAKAVSYHEESIASATEFSDVGIASSALLDAARLSRHLGNATRAREFYQRLLDLRRDAEDDGIDSTEYRALAIWGLEAVDGAFTRDTAERLQRLIDRGVPPDREQRKTVYDALAESLTGLGDLQAAVDLLQQSLRLRDELWAETLQLHAYSSAQAILIQEARRQADEERWRHEELAATFSQVERLNAENEALVRQLREQAVLLEHLSREDSLTGLLNRRAFDERHAEVLALAAGTPISTSFLDVDEFKRINDQYSHAVGDDVLETVARLIVETVREGDPVGRYGGEEFVLAMPGIDAAQARKYGERIRRSVNQFDWEQFAPGLTVTLCIGMWTATGDTTPDDSLANADRLLYDAKRAGKNEIRSGEG